MKTSRSFSSLHARMQALIAVKLSGSAAQRWFHVQTPPAMSGSEPSARWRRIMSR